MKIAQKILKELYPYVIIVIVVVLIRSFLITPIMVSGSSMDTTLANGEVMILNKLGKFTREKIVVVSKNFEGKDTIIKRIIALPGETIKCENGIIYINGEEYDDKYATNTTYDFAEVKLKDNEYFVMGDNRLVSKDSRMLGPVLEDEIEGTTSLVIWPIKKIGTVK